MIRNKNVLVVDDDRLTCRWIEKIMSAHDLSAMSVHSGREAISEISNTPFKLVFLDIHLPDINGLEVLKEIRRTSHNTEVVVMTGDTDHGIRQEALQGGAFRFIEKPFDAAKINDVLKSLFDVQP